MNAELAFPPLLDSTEKASTAAQRSFFLAIAGQFTFLALAALAAILSGDKLAGAGPVTTLLSFIAALALQISGVTSKLEKKWYAARAASESIKAASWEFSVGGEAFRQGDNTADIRFIEVLKSILSNVPSLDVGVSTDGSTITDSMKTLRSSPRRVRFAAYSVLRVDDQINWYATKAANNKARYKAFGFFVVVVEIVAVIFGILRISGDVQTDLIGPLAACAAGLIGWVQAKKYANLSEAYAVTSHEISFIPDILKSASNEAEWAQAVHDAEAAFSREHTMWQARRQGPM